MGKINAAVKMTDERFLNLYKLHTENKNGESLQYLVASRAKEVGDLKAINHKEKPDAVAMVGILDDERIVLIKQYRYPIGDYIYEFPAGLCDRPAPLCQRRRLPRPGADGIYGGLPR